MFYLGGKIDPLLILVLIWTYRWQELKNIFYQIKKNQQKKSEILKSEIGFFLDAMNYTLQNLLFNNRDGFVFFKLNIDRLDICSSLF